MTVVVGVDGAGRTHRLRALAAAVTGSVWFAGGVTAALEDAPLVVVDDAHRLDAVALRELAALCRAGVPMAVSRRPTIDRPELAALDEAASAGGVEVLGPLDPGAMARLVATVTGRPVSPEVAEAVHEASGGIPVVAVAIVTAPADDVAPALLARVQRRFAVLGDAAVTVARVLALRLDLGDPVLAAACGLDLTGLATALRTLRDEGLLLPSERMIPVMAEAVLAELPGAERRRIHDAVAGALLAAGADPVAAAGQLRAARAATPAAADVYRAAGERLRFIDPAAAIGWFDDAADASTGAAELAAGRAEASALLGLPVDVDQLTLTTSREKLVAGAVAAQEGRAARSAELLLAAGGPGPMLAVPALVALGRPVPATLGSPASTGSPAPAALVRLAEGALAATEPERALPLLIEATEAMERGSPQLVLPDTPHAIAAVVAVAAGDVASAEHLLTRARAARVGGPAADERHRLLLAWARMRAGHYDTALHELRFPPGAEPSGRDRLLRAALAAGIARRRGDIAGLRDAWTGIEPLLARRTVDLWQLEPLEELAVAAARLRKIARLTPVLDLLDDIVTGLGRPTAWSVALDWLRLQTAIVTEDAGAAAETAERMATTGGTRPRAQCVAARRWAEVLAGTVDTDEILAATEDLHAAELPWEASRLAGQAAIRTDDAGAARRLLERARELSEPEADSPGGGGGLSEREVTVARLVLAGSTHREIGAQLYIAPKTVEHHVARIRGKLGANTRAELLAMLREMLDG
ncbi:DNA-binding NarL/FixJ family response regulator [Actinoplanes campanulatus]|uniref:DNA-binding NarL/FixJ family response regulator n=1 Tax=Actinoplanes campanulatus TaxID=113559 RepID=A0A7W5FJJ3_9ACTN|nr:LuxR C-terminal-related transcriptional regulator [Actinoplanes campanulatus]MBB3100692.1 DNA-binding NarL/FixJ family response regulator [Actinoplanes campanulatus]GGN45459.1 helix-turn-helix transcriptional regulator [Actinoplanes campanulatus]GID41152.1 helix-turn-helix transcriptional regulator [Actinoplanes campanulatus]